MIPGDFEEGLLPFPSVAEAKRDPLYVDSGFIIDELSSEAPWTFSLLYGDGGAISIPLEAMFYEPLKGATAKVFRRHKTSGRIVPCQISQDDPALGDSSLQSLPWEQVLLRIIPPRFDTVLTPAIMDVLNQDQMICMALGVLRVLELQLMNPVLFGWSSAAKAEGPSAAVLRALARRGAVATADAAQLAAKLASEVSSLPVNRFLRFLEAVRRLSLMRAIPPQ